MSGGRPDYTIAWSTLGRAIAPMLWVLAVPCAAFSASVFSLDPDGAGMWPAPVVAWLLLFLATASLRGSWALAERVDARVTGAQLRELRATRWSLATAAIGFGLLEIAALSLGDAPWSLWRVGALVLFARIAVRAGWWGLRQPAQFTAAWAAHAAVSRLLNWLRLQLGVATVAVVLAGTVGFVSVAMGLADADLPWSWFAVDAAVLMGAAVWSSARWRERVSREIAAVSRW